MAIDAVCHLNDAQEAEEWFSLASNLDEEISFDKGIYMQREMQKVKNEYVNIILCNLYSFSIAILTSFPLFAFLMA